MTQKNSPGPFHRGPGLFGVNCCFCTAETNDGHPTSENGKLVVLTSGGREFRQHAEHTKSGDTTPASHAQKALSAGCTSRNFDKSKKITQPSGAATPRDSDAHKRIAVPQAFCVLLAYTRPRPKSGKVCRSDTRPGDVCERAERSEGIVM